MTNNILFLLCATFLAGLAIGLSIGVKIVERADRDLRDPVRVIQERGWQI